MRIRDALESDADALATATDRPREVMRNMIHDRSVRVAVEESGGEGGEGSGDGEGGEGSGDGEGEDDDGDESDGENGNDDGDESDGEGEDDDGDESDGEGEDDDGEETVRGFVAFDVRADTVHVTDFDGSGPTIERLFEEPRRFARREEMGVEVVVPNDEETSEIIEASGFTAAGSGPRFEGRRTTRYRIEFDELDGRNEA
ncbi:hypothetical protein [Halorubrum sp. HHNYT27]|uniref:hypothetical protein n=1 Tax=Halorubrum sp. HHNYT27 TaxID=3402275 RepID=UPI003EBFBD37